MAVAALPVIEIPQVPDAPVPLVKHTVPLASGKVIVLLAVNSPGTRSTYFPFPFCNVTPPKAVLFPITK